MQNAITLYGYETNMLPDQPDTNQNSENNDSTEEQLTGRILCVDDEQPILLSLKRVFRRSKHEVSIANSAAEALEFLEENEVDVVISDMRMPEMDGNRFLSEVAERWPKTMRMLLTGYSDIESTVGAINKGGIYRYIAKPWDDTDLLMCVQRALEIKSLRSERDKLFSITREQNEELLALNNSLEQKVRERTKKLEESNRNIELAYDESITVFSRIIGMREDNASISSEEVAKAADLVGAKLQLTDEQRKNLNYAAFLHDIGKIGLSDDLLKTPYSSLDNTQKEQFQQHCINGEALLLSLAPLHNASSIIRSHHEQVGGGGYPDGLKGDDIPIEARILFVVNEFNDLQSGILLGKPQSAQFASEYLQSHVGLRYDQSVVDAFLDINKSLDRNKSIQKELILDINNVEPGMILAEDIYLRDKVLMLRSGQVLTDTFIQKYKKLKQASNESTMLKIITN